MSETVTGGLQHWWRLLRWLSRPLVGIGHPIATAGAALLGAGVALAALSLRWRADTQAVRQRDEAERRAEWWRRTQWAIDRAVSDDVASGEGGRLMLLELVNSSLASTDEQRLLAQVASVVLDVTEDR